MYLWKKKILIPFAVTLATFSLDKLESKEYLKTSEELKQSQVDRRFHTI